MSVGYEEAFAQVTGPGQLFELIEGTVGGIEYRMFKNAPPTLGPAQPLTVAFIESLTRSLSGSVQAEVLPANVLAKADRMIVWWTPARRRQMFYENSEGKAAELNGCIFPQPPLVWRVSNGELSIRALTGNKRPDSSTKLAVAPFWNLSDDGRVCTGTMRRPDSASVASIPRLPRGELPWSKTKPPGPGARQARGGACPQMPGGKWTRPKDDRYEERDYWYGPWLLLSGLGAAWPRIRQEVVRR